MSNISKNLNKYLPAGTTVLSLLLALYYGTVVLAGFHFTVLQIVTLWGLVLIFMPAYRASLTRGEVGLFLSIAAIFAIAVLSYVVNGLWDHPDANLSRYARFLFFVPLYLVMRRFATAAGFWRALLCGALATGIWAVLEFNGWVHHPYDRWRQVSGAVNSIQFGDLSLVMAAMVAAGMPVYRAYGRPYFLVAIVAVALGLFACLAANTRGAWIAMPALGLLLCWIFLRTGFTSPRKMTGLVAATALLLTVLISQTHFISGVQSEIQQVRDYEQGKIGNSAGIRFEMWRLSWEVFKANPVLGPGPGMYLSEGQKLGVARGGFDANALTYSHPHSEYFFVLATLGSLGMLALGLLFLVPLTRFVRAMLSDDEALCWPGLAGTVMIVGYLHFGLTEALLYQHATFLGFYLLSVAVLAKLTDKRQSNKGASA